MEKTNQAEMLKTQFSYKNIRLNKHVKKNNSPAFLCYWNSMFKDLEKSILHKFLRNTYLNINV